MRPGGSRRGAPSRVTSCLLDRTGGYRRRVRSLVLVYFALTSASVGIDRALTSSEPLGSGRWWLGKVALPLGMSVLVWALARRRGSPRDVLLLRPPPPHHLALALAAGAPACLVVLGHGVTQGFSTLHSESAGLLVLRIALDQAWLEEWMARGFLLGGLLAAGQSAQRAIWVSAACFALMHLEQFLWPPLSVEGLVNGVVLVVLTLPMGWALGWLAARSRSVAPSVLLHFLVDLMILPQKLQQANTAAILAAGLTSVLIVALASRLRMFRR